VECEMRSEAGGVEAQLRTLPSDSSKRFVAPIQGEMKMDYSQARAASARLMRL
jgi:hypothetical protein